MSNELKRRLSVAEAEAHRLKGSLHIANQTIADLTRELQIAKGNQCQCGRTD